MSAVDRDRFRTSLNAALETNDLGRICRAIDQVLKVIGLQKMADAAEINRVTLYRAFRLETATRLDLLIKILYLLDLELEVRTRSLTRSPSKEKSARSLSSAFARRDLSKILNSFAMVVRKEDNVTELAKMALLRRETLYQAFSQPRIPRFSTVLSILNALGMHFAVHSI
ncbi:MAG: hypothetical protein ABI561_24520 [Bradyrhizobium sp.]